MSALCELRRATLGYGSHAVLSDVDLAVAAGDFIVIGGPNGGGKSTLLKTLAGLIEPLGGEARRDARFGYVPQQASLELPLPVTALELVRLGTAVAMPWWRAAWPGDHALACDYLRTCRAEELADLPFSSLSGGQRQRVLLARALATRPNCLLLDEPTAGVDHATQILLADMLGGMARTRHLAVVVVTHERDPFEKPATRHLHVEEGRIRS